MEKPALDPISVEPRTGTIYPLEFAAAVAGRVKRRLGEPLGLTDFGVNLVELAPGAGSSLRHWHSHEDEFVFVLSGVLTLVTEAGEQELRPGQCAGFAKNSGDGHCLLNRTAQPATYLEVGSRNAADRVVYPDQDLVLERRAVFTRKDGTAY